MMRSSFGLLAMAALTSGCALEWDLTEDGTYDGPGVEVQEAHIEGEIGRYAADGDAYGFVVRDGDQTTVDVRARDAGVVMAYFDIDQDLEDLEVGEVLRIDEGDFIGCAGPWDEMWIKERTARSFTVVVARTDEVSVTVDFNARFKDTEFLGGSFVVPLD
ncbi:MAG: hypothetical protein AAGA48_00660 [Myxococcota bacterium]